MCALAVALLAALCLPGLASAGNLSATVQDTGGQSVQDAVVYAVPLGSDGRPASLPRPLMIDQVDKEYVPYVTAVRVGTQVNFPNRDQIRHHVYSFSKAKTFEIPLYTGTPRDPILFDKAGVVVLGCNIHDWMKAYVFVAETPHFAVTDESGRATLSGLPARDYRVEVWHPRLKGSSQATGQQVSVGAGGGESLTFAIDQKRVWRPRRAPSMGGGSYN
jgi:plastocyanin